MKGKDPRYPAIGECNWLRADFDEWGKPENPEKNPLDQIEIDWNSTYNLMAEARVEPGSQSWEVGLITAKPHRSGLGDVNKVRFF